MAEVTNYLKNITKSLAYTASEVLSRDDMAGETMEFMKQFKTPIVSTFAILRTPKSSFRRAVDAIENSKIYNALNYGMKNAFEDIRTGNLYNKERSEQAAGELMGLNVDDWDNLDDFNDEPTSSIPEERSKATDGDLLVADTVEGTNAAVANTIATAIGRSTEINAKLGKTTTGLIYNQNERLFSRLDSSIGHIHNSMEIMFNMQQAAFKNIDENTSRFFTENIKLDNERNAILKEIVERLRLSNKTAAELEKQKADSEKERKEKRKKYTWDDVSNNGFINIGEYFGAVKKNINDMMGSSIPTIGEGGVAGMIKAMAASPLQWIPSMIVDKLIPNVAKDAIKEFNNTLKGVFPTLLGRLMNVDEYDGGIWSIVKKVFGINLHPSETLDTTTYEKGAVPFDGITRRAITEVIPAYLRKMVAAMTGTQEVVFDYSTGKWVKVKDVMKDYTELKDGTKKKKRVTSELNSRFGDAINRAVNSKIIGKKDADKAMQELAAYLIKYNGDINFEKDRSQIADKIDSNDYQHLLDYYDIIRSIVTESGTKLTKAGRFTRNTSNAFLADIVHNAGMDDYRAMKNMQSQQSSAIKQVVGDTNSSAFGTKEFGWKYNPDSDKKEHPESYFLYDRVNSKGESLFGFLRTITRDIGVIRNWQNPIGGSGNAGGNPVPPQPLPTTDNSKKQSTRTEEPVEEEIITINQSEVDRLEELLEKTYGQDAAKKIRESMDNDDYLKYLDRFSKAKKLNRNFLEYNTKKALGSKAFKDFMSTIGEDTDITEVQTEEKKIDVKEATKSKFNEVLKKTGSTFKAIGAAGTEAFVNILYAADRAIYDMMFKYELKNEETGEKYKGFMDMIAGKTKETFNDIKKYLVEDIWEPLKKHFNISDDFGNEYKQSLKDILSAAGNYIMGSYSDVYSPLVDKARQFTNDPKKYFNSIADKDENGNRTKFTSDKDKVVAYLKKKGYTDADIDDILANAAHKEGDKVLYNINELSTSAKNIKPISSLTTILGTDREQVRGVVKIGNEDERNAALAKMGITTRALHSAMQQSGMTDEQIDKLYDQSMIRTTIKNPNATRTKVVGGEELLRSIKDKLGDRYDEIADRYHTKTTRVVNLNRDILNKNSHNEIKQIAESLIRRIDDPNRTIYEEIIQNTNINDFTPNFLKGFVGRILSSRHMQVEDMNNALSIFGKVEDKTVHHVTADVFDRLAELKNPDGSSMFSTDELNALKFGKKKDGKVVQRAHLQTEKTGAPETITTQSLDLLKIAQNLSNQSAFTEYASQNPDQIKEIFTANNAKGTMQPTGKPFMGNTMLSKGELLFNSKGVNMVNKTDAYKITEPTHILNAADSHDLLSSMGMKNLGPKKSVAESYNDEMKVKKDLIKKSESHAAGTYPISNIDSSIAHNAEGDTKVKIRTVKKDPEGADPTTVRGMLDIGHRYLPETLAGATVGGITSLLLGIVGGPLLGAAIGGGISLVRSSDTIKNMLFGEAGEDGERAGGVVSKGVMGAFKKYFPDMLKFGIAGILPGLFTPLGPIGGLMAGAAFGFLKHNESFKNTFFGDKDKVIITDKEKTIIKKLFPAAGKGAIGGALWSLFLPTPFGFLGNAAIGAAIGMMTSTDEFKDFILGVDVGGIRTGGLVGMIKDVFSPLTEAFKDFKDRFINAIEDNVFDPLRRFMRPAIHELPRLLGAIPKKLNDYLNHSFGGSMIKNVLNVMLSPVTLAGKVGLKTAGLATQAATYPFRIFGWAGDKIRKRQLNNYTADDMTAEERIKFRVLNGMELNPEEGKNKFDDILSKTKLDDLRSIRDNLYSVVDSKKDLDNRTKKSWNDVRRSLYDVRFGNNQKMSGRSISKIGDFLQRGMVREAYDVIKNSGMTQEEFNSFINSGDNPLNAKITRFTDLVHRQKQVEGKSKSELTDIRKSMMDKLVEMGVDLDKKKFMKDTEYVQRFAKYFDTEATHQEALKPEERNKGIELDTKRNELLQDLLASTNILAKAMTGKITEDEKQTLDEIGQRMQKENTDFKNYAKGDAGKGILRANRDFERSKAKNIARLGLGDTINELRTINDKGDTEFKVKDDTIQNLSTQKGFFGGWRRNSRIDNLRRKGISAEQLEGFKGNLYGKAYKFIDRYGANIFEPSALAVIDKLSDLKASILKELLDNKYVMKIVKNEALNKDTVEMLLEFSTKSARKQFFNLCKGYYTKKVTMDWIKNAAGVQTRKTQDIINTTNTPVTEVTAPDTSVEPEVTPEQYSAEEEQQAQLEEMQGRAAGTIKPIKNIKGVDLSHNFLGTALSFLGAGLSGLGWLGGKALGAGLSGLGWLGGKALGATKLLGGKLVDTALLPYTLARGGFNAVRGWMDRGTGAKIANNGAVAGNAPTGDAAQQDVQKASTGRTIGTEQLDNRQCVMVDDKPCLIKPKDGGGWEFDMSHADTAAVINEKQLKDDDAKRLYDEQIKSSSFLSNMFSEANKERAKSGLGKVFNLAAYIWGGGMLLRSGILGKFYNGLIKPLWTTAIQPWWEQSAWPAIKEGWTWVKRWFGGDFKKWWSEKAWPTIKTEASNLFDGILNGISNIGEFIASGFTAYGEFWNEYLQPVWDNFYENTLKPWWDNTIVPWWNNTASPFINGLIDRVIDAISLKDSEDTKYNRQNRYTNVYDTTTIQQRAQSTGKSESQVQNDVILSHINKGTKSTFYQDLSGEYLGWRGWLGWADWLTNLLPGYEDAKTDYTEIRKMTEMAAINLAEGSSYEMLRIIINLFNNRDKETLKCDMFNNAKEKYDFVAKDASCKKMLDTFLWNFYNTDISNKKFIDELVKEKDSWKFLFDEHILQQNTAQSVVPTTTNAYGTFSLNSVYKPLVNNAEGTTAFTPISTTPFMLFADSYTSITDKFSAIKLDEHDDIKTLINSKDTTDIFSKDYWKIKTSSGDESVSSIETVYNMIYKSISMPILMVSNIIKNIKNEFKAITDYISSAEFSETKDSLNDFSVAPLRWIYEKIYGDKKPVITVPNYGTGTEETTETSNAPKEESNKSPEIKKPDDKKKEGARITAKKVTKTPEVVINDILKKSKTGMGKDDTTDPKYLEAQAKKQANLIDKVKKEAKYGKGYSKQTDPEVKNISYNSNDDTKKQTIGDSGCGPVAAVNAMEYMHKYGTGKFNILSAARYALTGGFKEKNGGTHPNFFREYFRKNGFNSQTTVDRDKLRENILSGMPTVLMGKDENGESPETPFGKIPHYITVTGVDKQSGNAIVQDPEAKVDNQLYPIKNLLNKSSVGVSTFGRGKYGMYGAMRSKTLNTTSNGYAAIMQDPKRNKPKPTTANVEDVAKQVAEAIVEPATKPEVKSNITPGVFVDPNANIAVNNKLNLTTTQPLTTLGLQSVVERQSADMKRMYKEKLREVHDRSNGALDDQASKDLEHIAQTYFKPLTEVMQDYRNMKPLPIQLPIIVPAAKPQVPIDNRSIIEEIKSRHDTVTEDDIKEAAKEIYAKNANIRSLQALRALDPEIEKLAVAKANARTNMQKQTEAVTPPKPVTQAAVPAQSNITIPSSLPNFVTQEDFEAARKEVYSKVRPTGANQHIIERLNADINKLAIEKANARIALEQQQKRQEALTSGNAEVASSDQMSQEQFNTALVDIKIENDPNKKAQLITALSTASGKPTNEINAAASKLDLQSVVAPKNNGYASTAALRNQPATPPTSADINAAAKVEAIKAATEVAKKPKDQQKATMAKVTEAQGKPGVESGYKSKYVKDGDIQKSAWTFFRGKGYSSAATAGILGNMQQESAFRPTVINSSNHAGLFQWAKYGDASSRWGHLQTEALKHGTTWENVNQQLEHANRELSNGTAYFGKKNPESNWRKAGISKPITFEEFKATNDPAMAARAFEATFERSGGSAIDNRMKYAGEFYKLYHNSNFDYSSLMRNHNPEASVSSNGSASASTPTVTGSGENGKFTFKDMIKQFFVVIKNFITSLFGGSSDSNDNDGSSSVLYAGQPYTGPAGGDIKKVLNIASKEHGYKEKKDNNKLDDPYANAGSNNWTKYARDMRATQAEFKGLMPNPQWCATFVSWVARNAGIGTDVIPNFYNCQTGFNALKKVGANEVDKVNAAPGDLVFYHGSVKGESNPRYHHVGYVEGADHSAKKIKTIEGNSSDAVSKQSLSMSDAKIHIVRPKYKNIKDDVTVAPVPGFTQGGANGTNDEYKPLSQYGVYVDNLNENKFNNGTKYGRATSTYTHTSSNISQYNSDYGYGPGDKPESKPTVTPENASTLIRIADAVDEIKTSVKIIAVNAVNASGGNLANEIANASATIKTAKRELLDTVDGLMKTPGKFIDAAANKIASTANTIAEMPGKMIGGVTDRINGTINNASSQINKTVDNIASAPGRMVGGVTDRVNRTVDNIANAPGRMMDGITRNRSGQTPPINRTNPDPVMSIISALAAIASE